MSNTNKEHELNQEHIDWCGKLFTSLHEGGTWGVPRSGLMFRKENGKLVLFDQLPFSPEMSEAAERGRDVPATEEQLRTYQQGDFDATVANFKAAGIEVVSSLQEAR